MTETGGKQFSIGVENELRKDQLFREVIERLKGSFIKRKNTLLRLPGTHSGTVFLVALRSVRDRSSNYALGVMVLKR